MSKDTKALKDMTLDELKETKKKWYRQAKEDGSLKKCYMVCKVLGEKLDAKYGPKYRFLDDENDIELYVDDYGNYFTARWKGCRVMSTHPCDNLFIPGDWMKVINKLYPVAEERSRNERERSDENRRREMVKELSV